MNSEVLARIRQAYSLIQSNRSLEGFPRDITRSGRVAAILAAHAAYPTSHKNAQGYAQLLVDDLGINTVLKNIHPCIVLGIPAAYKYIVLEGRIDKIFGPFRPACIVHKEHYVRCHPECEYGVKLEDKWVHEILNAQP